MSKKNIKDLSKQQMLDRYGEMSEIEHILERSGLYIGDVHTNLSDYALYIPSKHKIMKLKNIKNNEALLKLFDEIITNSIDARIDSDRLFDVDTIDVTINPNGKFIVRDNGGIPVIKNKKGEYIPEMLFGRLRTSTNYKEMRETSGLNGLGAKLTNIFSKSFKVTTADGKYKFIGIWSNNMRDFKLESITKVENGEHFTEVEFDLELERFIIDKIDDNLMRTFQKRCIDGSAISPNLTINFTAEETLDGLLNSTWCFKNFKEFVELHIDEKSFDDIEHIHYKGDNFEVVILQNIGYNYGMVNGASCSIGTHIKRIENQITKHLLNQLAIKDNITLITPNDIMNKVSFFINCKVVNPFFDSQSKDDLRNKFSNKTFVIPEKVLDIINDGEIYNQLKDYHVTKYEAEKNKIRRKINDSLRKTKPSINKLINCKNKVGNECFIFEGTSAQGGFKAVRDYKTQMAYLLTGKIKNSLDISDTQLFENREFKEQIVSLDLRLNTPTLNLKNCTADKIIFATDADFDGYHITGLLIVFYAMWFPELFKDGRIYRLLAPIGIATKGSGKNKEEYFYYTYDDYDKGKEELNGKGFTFMYKKGLGSLNDDHYKKLIMDKKLERIILSENYEKTLREWFSSSTKRRKEILEGDDLFESK